MRAFIFIAFAASVSARTLFERQNIPACAETCIATAAAAAPSCGGNEACYCTTSAFLEIAVSCVSTSCDASDTATALAAAQSLCAASGVTVNLASLSGAATASGSAMSASAMSTPMVTNPGGPMSSMSVPAGCSYMPAETMAGGSVMPAMTLCPTASSMSTNVPSGCSYMPAETMSGGSVMPAMTICSSASAAASSSTSAAAGHIKAPTTLAGFLALLGLAIAL